MGVLNRILHRRQALGVLSLVAASLTCADPTNPGSRLWDRWRQPQVDFSNAGPVVDGDLVYFGTGDGQIVARTRKHGNAVWSASVYSPVLGSRLIVRNGVIVASTMYNTVAISTNRGATLWSYAAPLDTVGGGTYPGYVVQNHMDADSELVFIPAWGASVSAVEIQNGRRRWVWQPGRATTDTAASGVFRSGAVGVRVSGDTVYAIVWHFLIASGVATELWVVALDRSTGHELWRVTLPCYWSGTCTDGAPAIYGSLVIVNQGAHEYAIDRRTQRLAWDFPTQPLNTTVSESELHGDVVYHDGGDGAIYALRATDGTLVWKSVVNVTATSDLLVTDRYVVFSEGMYLHILNRATGTQLLELQTRAGLNEPITAAAAAAPGEIYLNDWSAAWSVRAP